VDGLGRAWQGNAGPGMNANGRESKGRERGVDDGGLGEPWGLGGQVSPPSRLAAKDRVTAGAVDTPPGGERCW